MKIIMSTDRDVWTVLGLAQPSGGIRYDTRTIKKAYAKVLKSIDQSGLPAFVWAGLFWSRFRIQVETAQVEVDRCIESILVPESA